jgi:endonuclease/exonuclease/phosphatase family metal-dependent hydrolase
MATFRVMTWNVLYGGVGREELLRREIAAIAPDLAVFTEVGTEPALRAFSDVVGPHVAICSRTRSGERVAIVSRWPIAASASFGPPWSRAKWIEAEIDLPNHGRLRVQGVHLVAHQLWPLEWWRRREARYLAGHRRAHPGPTIVAGDFNTFMPGDGIDRERAPLYVRLQWLALGGFIPRWALRVLTDAGFVDCYRACHPEAEGFTMASWNPTARIDYIFASRELAPRLRGSGSGLSTPATQPPPSRTLAQMLGRVPTTSLGAYPSDHLPVWADFGLGES